MAMDMGHPSQYFIACPEKAATTLPSYRLTTTSYKGSDSTGKKQGENNSLKWLIRTHVTVGTRNL